MNKYLVSINHYKVTFVDNSLENKTVTMWATPKGVAEWVETHHKSKSVDAITTLLEVGPIQEGEPVMTVEELRAKMSIVDV